MSMENHEPMSTTAGHWSRQSWEFKIEHPGALALVSSAGGGPLDATNFLAAGSCNSTQWRGIQGPIPHQTEIERGAA